MAATPTPVSPPAPTGTISHTPPEAPIPPTRTNTRGSEKKKGIFCRLRKLLKKILAIFFWLALATLFLTNYRDAFPESAAKFQNVYTFVDNYLAPFVEAGMGLINTIFSGLKELWEKILIWINGLGA